MLFNISFFLFVLMSLDLVSLLFCILSHPYFLSNYSEYFILLLSIGICNSLIMFIFLRGVVFSLFAGFVDFELVITFVGFLNLFTRFC